MDFTISISVQADTLTQAERIAARLRTIAAHHGGRTALYVKDPIGQAVLVSDPVRSMAELDVAEREESPHGT